VHILSRLCHQETNPATLPIPVTVALNATAILPPVTTPRRNQRPSRLRKRLQNQGMPTYFYQTL
ncbi:hypothetical protein OS493_040147, partial [Desmophyllum pertusum]